VSISIVALLTVASLFTAVISALCGMGGGIILLSIMTLFLPLNIIIPVHGLVQLVSNLSRTYFLRSYIKKTIAISFALGLPLGAYIAVFFIKKISDTSIPYFFIAAVILYTLYKPKNLPAITLPFKHFWILGFVVGLAGPLIGATGPILAQFFIRDDLSRQEIVANKASIQFLGHLIKIPVFLAIGFQYQDHALLSAAMIIFGIIGTKYGVKLLHSIQDATFTKIFRIGLTLASIRLIYKAFLMAS
jgi:uncharacterized membrane protein YfcA